jgi:ribosome biogenesis protein SSF1/2
LDWVGFGRLIINMPRRGRRRRKHRTHVEEENLDPSVLISRRGQVGPYLKKLVQELRIVHYPNSPLKFQENARASLKDLISIARSNFIDHLMFITSTSTSSYLKAVKLPKGPTVTFKLNEFTLSSDVRESLKKQIKLQPDFRSPPLLVMKGVEGTANLLFRSIFPSLPLEKIKLKRCKRVVLIDQKDGVFSFRHYMIKARPAGISQALKKLGRNQIPNLNKFNSVNEWIEEGGNGSESEYEDAEINEDSQKKVSLRLVEIGPRLSFTLHKVEEGVSSGNVLFHAIVKKSKKKEKIDADKARQKRINREESIRKQNESVKKKLLKRRQRLNIVLTKKRKVSSGRSVVANNESR